MKKTELIKGLGLGALSSVCIVLTVLLDRAVYNNFFIGLSWGVAVYLLLIATAFFICSPQTKIRAIVFLCIGSAMFIVNAFVFVDRIIVAVYLSLTVAFAIAGLILLSNALKQKAEVNSVEEKECAGGRADERVYTEKDGQ